MLQTKSTVWVFTRLVNKLHPQPHGLNGGALRRATRRLSAGMSDGYSLSDLIMIGKETLHKLGHGNVAVQHSIRVLQAAQHLHRKGSRDTFAVSWCRGELAGRSSFWP